MSASANVNPGEIEKFARIAEEWWDPFGKIKPLHKLNPVRLGFIRDEACAHFGRDRLNKRPLEGLRLVDIGCGGGLVCEPMRRLGAEVGGLDVAAESIGVARAHAAETGLDIDYRIASADDLAATDSETFDIVLNLEAVEHVPDPTAFIAASARLLKPGGLMIVSTINRTFRALALAKIGAEYILRWVPRGAHDPRKFVRPEELRAMLAAAGLDPAGPVGMSYQPVFDAWRISDDPSINYLFSATRAPAGTPPDRTQASPDAPAARGTSSAT